MYVCGTVTMRSLARREFVKQVARNAAEALLNVTNNDNNVAELLDVRAERDAIQFEIEQLKRQLREAGLEPAVDGQSENSDSGTTLTMATADLEIEGTHGFGEPFVVLH